MSDLQNISKKEKKEFSPKDAIIGFGTLSFISLGILFALHVNDVLTFQELLSFQHSTSFILYIVVATILLLVLGITLTYLLPSQSIDDTNKTYQSFSLNSIVIFMFFGALYEELLFRAIIQNVIYIFWGHYWLAIIIATLLFVAFHFQYFKKPIMLLNITIPGLTFGWIYFETNNILVPLVAHFLVNLIMTLLFKYNLIKLKN